MKILSEFKRIGHIKVTGGSKLEAPLEQIVYKILETLPQSHLSFVKEIRVGDYEIQDSLGIYSLYDSGIVYIDRDIKSNEELFLSLIHEIGHAVEENNFDLLYGDEQVIKEFISKRKALTRKLEVHGYDVSSFDIEELSYSKENDLFLLDYIGYDKLRSLISGIFLDPYSVTSLREYYATAFERYATDPQAARRLEAVSPKLLEKLKQLFEESR